MRLLNSITACVIALAVTMSCQADEGMPGAPGDELNARLSAMSALDADFSQTTIDSSNRTLQENSGHLWVRSPARFRIETHDPFAQTLVSDGTSFWSYDAELEQVIIRDLEADIRQVPILLLSGDTEQLTDEYDVSYYEDETREYFVLAPRASDSLFESLSIEFANEMPSSITIADSLGQRTRIDLSTVAVNQPQVDNPFTFEPPPGVDVIDDRVPE